MRANRDNYQQNKPCNWTRFCSTAHSTVYVKDSNNIDMLSFPLCLVLYLCVNPYYVSSLPSIRIQRLMSPSAVGPIHLVPVIHSHHMVQLNDHFYLGESTKSHDLLAGIRAFLIAPAFAQVPTNTEIKLLRSALDAVYGEKDPAKALPLLSDAISAWETKAPDERAALYRVRGDCYLVRRM